CLPVFHKQNGHSPNKLERCAAHDTFCGILQSVKWLLILAILFSRVCISNAAEESLGTKSKKAFEAAATPTPNRKHRKRSSKKATPTPSPTASPKPKKASPTPSPSPTSKTKSKRKKASPTPTPAESAPATETPSPTPAETPTPSPPQPSAREKKGAPNVSLSPDEIVDYENYPPKVRQILDAGLGLTKQNPGYTYGSADPKNGGMDCSGFIYYVLQQNGFREVPRDSSQQYVW